MTDVVVPPGSKALDIVIVPHVRCRELDGAHFDTDKSFVRPDGLPLLGEVSALLAANASRRALIFGHTDTVGAEDYNKRLSEKRARSVFAALTQTPKVWEELYNAESWGIARIQVMLATVLEPDDPQPSSSGTLDKATVASVKRFQSKHPPLDVDGDPGPETRRELFTAYFKKGSADAVDGTRFVVFGGTPFMGCGEYNPYTEGAADQASRRVIVQIFDRSAEPHDLPCKIGDIGPCQANLLAAGEAPPPEDPPKMQHFRCKVFRGIERRCTTKPPAPVPPVPVPEPGKGSWDLPSVVVGVPGAGGRPPEGQSLVFLLDDAGEPIAGIALATPQGSGTTDASGSAAVPGALPGDKVSAPQKALAGALGSKAFARPFLRRDDRTWTSIAELAKGIEVADPESTIVVATRIVVAIRSSSIPLDVYDVRKRSTKAKVAQGVTRSRTQLKVEALALGVGEVLEVFLPNSSPEEVIATLDLDAIAADPSRTVVTLEEEPVLDLPESAPDVGSKDDEPTKRLLA